MKSSSSSNEKCTKYPIKEMQATWVINKENLSVLTFNDVGLDWRWIWFSDGGLGSPVVDSGAFGGRRWSPLLGKIDGSYLV